MSWTEIGFWVVIFLSILCTLIFGLSCFWLSVEVGPSGSKLTGQFYFRGNLPLAMSVDTFVDPVDVGPVTTVVPGKCLAVFIYVEFHR